jgi:hypothetical protein
VDYDVKVRVELTTTHKVMVGVVGDGEADEAVFKEKVL